MKPSVIIEQLKMCKFTDESGHRLERNAAFENLELILSGEAHMSDCSSNNHPAEPYQECDCKFKRLNEEIRRLEKGPRCNDDNASGGVKR